MNNGKIKISIVNYFNTLPFRWALKNSPFIHKIDLQEDIPSICAEKLKLRQVDIGLVPVALLNELDHYTIITDFCIGASGKVDSVKLYSNGDINAIKTVTLDYQSRSSIALTKILAKEYWNIKPQYLNASPGFENSVTGENAIVVIGDRTFDLNGRFKYEWDLSEEWQKFTGLPFVFAAWVCNSEKIPGNFEKEFNEVLQFGVNNISASIAGFKPNTVPLGIDALDYLSKKIDYNLNDEKKKALSLFLGKLKTL